jgi:hypothetical protein
VIRGGTELTLPSTGTETVVQRVGKSGGGKSGGKNGKR